MRRRLVIAGAVLVLVALGVGVAYVLHVRHQGRDIRGSSTVQFVQTQVPAKPKVAAKPPVIPEKKPARKAKAAK